MTENTADRRRWPAWTVPVVAGAAAVAVWLVGAALGVELEARTGSGTQPVTVLAVLVAALVVGLAGWGVRALIGRLTKGGGQVAWLALCGVVLLGSLLGATSGTTPEAIAILMAEHMVVGFVVALGLRNVEQRVTPAAAST